MPGTSRRGGAPPDSHLIDQAVGTALAITRLAVESPTGWLDAGALCIHSGAFKSHAVHAFVCDPFIRSRKWRVVCFGAAGMPDGRSMRSLRAAAKRHWPDDDVLPAVTATHDEPVEPNCAARSSLVATRAWRASRLHHARLKLKLHELIRAIHPLPDGHALVMQIDGHRKSWSPSEVEVSLSRAYAEALAQGFARDFIAPLRRRRELLDELTVAQRSVVDLLAAGLPERVIAKRIDRSAHTVHEHVKGIYKAWGVRNRYHLRDLWLGADGLPGYEVPQR